MRKHLIINNRLLVKSVRYLYVLKDILLVKSQSCIDHY